MPTQVRRCYKFFANGGYIGITGFISKGRISNYSSITNSWMRAWGEYIVDDEAYSSFCSDLRAQDIWFAKRTDDLDG